MHEQSEYTYTERKCTWTEQDEAEWKDLLDEADEAYDAMSDLEINMTDYQSQGHADRRAYLDSLCDEYPRSAVYAIAGVLGPSEDFDALVTALEDYAQEYDA